MSVLPNSSKLIDVSAMNQQQLVEKIHTTVRPLVLSITGGGSGAISSLLEVPGASATVLEAVVPYASRALEQWLGGTPDNYCSERTVRAMAMAAFQRARDLSDADPHTLLGIGATASLISNRPKRSPHRIHVAWQSANTTSVVSCELPKGARTRAEEENVATQLILAEVAAACGLQHELPFDRDLTLVRNEQRAPKSWTNLLLGEQLSIQIPPSETSGAPIAVFPGAFNPIHSAHQRMAAIAARKLACPVTFELSIANVDKPPLDFIEIAGRVQQFAGERLLLTRAPHFTDKSLLAPGCTFVVGADTVIRIGDPKYYGGGFAERDAAITKLAAAGCRFLVFGRSVQGQFQSLTDTDIPAALRAICDEVPESDFREDISSTELRGA